MTKARSKLTSQRRGFKKHISIIVDFNVWEESCSGRIVEQHREQKVEEKLLEKSHDESRVKEEQTMFTVCLTIKKKKNC